MRKLCKQRQAVRSKVFFTDDAWQPQKPHQSDWEPQNVLETGRKQNLKNVRKPEMHQSLRGNTNHFKFSLAGTSTTVFRVSSPREPRFVLVPYVFVRGRRGLGQASRVWHYRVVVSLLFSHAISIPRRRWETLQEGTLRGELEKLNLKVRWGRLRSPLKVPSKPTKTP